MNKKLLAKAAFINFCTIFTLNLNAGGFEQKCIDAHGNLEEKNWLCRCEIAKQYFDPYYSVCGQTSVEDLDENHLKDPDLSLINNYASLLHAYENNECHANFLTSKKAALRVMRGAFKYLGLSFKDAPGANTNFVIRMTTMWQMIFNKIYSDIKNDVDYPRIMKLYPARSDAVIDIKYQVKSAIENGIIPLPVYDGLSHYFKSSDMMRALYAGFAPVDIKQRSIKEINEFHTHSLFPSFTNDGMNFAYHDIQHASLLSKNLQRMGLTAKSDKKFYFSEKKCRAIQDDLNRIINTSTENKSFNLRPLAYFYIHESLLVLQYFNSHSFLDFVLELWQNHIKMSIPEMIFGKNVVDNRDRVIDLCNQIYKKIDEQNDANKPTKFWQGSFLEPFLLGLPDHGKHEESYTGLLFTLAKSCLLTHNVKRYKQSFISSEQYNLNDKINESLDGFAQYFNQWENARQQFLSTIKTEIHPLLFKKWHDNRDAYGKWFSEI